MQNEWQLINVARVSSIDDVLLVNVTLVRDLAL